MSYLLFLAVLAVSALVFGVLRLFGARVTLMDVFKPIAIETGATS